MAAPNVRAAMMDRWGLPLEVPDAAIAGLLPTAREAIVSQYAGFRLKLTRQFKRSQKHGANPLGATICGFPIAPPASFARDLGPEEYLAVHSAYLDVLRKCLQQKRIDTAEQAADERRAARMPDPEPSDSEEDSNDGPSAFESDGYDSDEQPHVPPVPAAAAPLAPPLALPPAPAPIPAPAAPAAPDPVPMPAAKRARLAPAPAPVVPSPTDAMLERLTPDRIGAFVLRLEVPKWKKDADKASFLLNDLLGTDFRDLNCFPNAVTKRFKAAMTERGYDLKVVGNVGEHFRVRETGKPVRLKREARRPTGVVFFGCPALWLGG